MGEGIGMSATDHDLFEWMGDAAAARLNGSSDFRTCLPMRFLRAGDGVRGEVVAVERAQTGYRNQWIDEDGLAKIVVRVEVGRSDGSDLASGEWVSFWLAYADLRRAWQQVGGIEKGDRVTFGYLGKQAYRYGERHAFACGVEREKDDGEEW